MAKNGSFSFAKGRLVFRAKPNVPFVGWQNFKIFCAVGKKLKHRRVGNECRLTRCPFVVSFLCLCSLVKMVYFISVFSRLFVVVGSSSTLAGNLFTSPPFFLLASILRKTSTPLVCFISKVKIIAWRFYVSQVFHA